MTDFAPLMPLQYEAWSEVDILGMVVKLDGTPYAATSATWTENAHGAGDTLSVSIPLSPNPDFPTQLFRGTYDGATAAEIAKANSDVIIELWVGFTENPMVSPSSVSQLTRFFLGEVDTYSGAFAEDMVTFKARSLAAHLIDDRLVRVSTSETMARFITELAARYNLPTPVVNIAATPATIQEILAFDQIDGSNFQASLNDMHPMDLMIRGAQVDDTDTWVDVRTGTIHYESPSLVQRGSPIALQFGRDWVSLTPSHAPQFSKNVEVIAYTHQPHTRISTAVRVSDDGNGNVTTTVRSGIGTSEAILGTNQIVSTSTMVNQATGATSTSTSVSSTTGGNATLTASQGASDTSKQRYALYLGNVDPATAVARAQAYRRQITQHEYQIEGVVPITNRLLQQLSITSLLQISGARWGLTNGTYYPRSIEYTASVTEGWKATISALNHPPAQNGV